MFQPNLRRAPMTRGVERRSLYPCAIEGGKVSEQHEVEEITPAEAHSLCERGAFLLDVREQDEWDAGHAPSAHHIALGELESRHREIPMDRTILCVCRGGSRSAYAAAALGVVGFTALNVRGGMHEWEAASLPVVAQDGPGQVI